MRWGLTHCLVATLGAGRQVNAAAAIAFALLAANLFANPRASLPQEPTPRLFRVQRVVDGDTLILESVGRVRLIGVDTPESVHPGRPVQEFALEAAAFLRKIVDGREVRIEYDWQRQDRYRRTLAYVFLSDGTFVNEEIVRQGYGFAYTHFPFKYLERFRQLEREAREQGRGLWAK